MINHHPEDTTLERFSVHKLWNSILKALNLEKGIFYTVINLVIRPGKTLRTYLFEDRSKLVKPLSFLLLTTAIAAYLTHNFIDFDTMMEGMGEASAGQPEMDEQTKAAMDNFKQQYAQYIVK